MGHQGHWRGAPKDERALKVGKRQISDCGAQTEEKDENGRKEGRRGRSASGMDDEGRQVPRGEGASVSLTSSLSSSPRSGRADGRSRRGAGSGPGGRSEVGGGGRGGRVCRPPLWRARRRTGSAGLVWGILGRGHSPDGAGHSGARAASKSASESRGPTAHGRICPALRSFTNNRDASPRIPTSLSPDRRARHWNHRCH